MNVILTRESLTNVFSEEKVKNRVTMTIKMKFPNNRRSQLRRSTCLQLSMMVEEIKFKIAKKF